MYISITGLRLKSFIHGPRFWWHAIASMRQAQSAADNVRSDARTINGVHHTLTVWQSRQAMHAYLTSGAHLKSLRVFKHIATGKVLGFDADTVPDWEEAHSLWIERGREV